MVWFTGLSGSGKSTIANVVEKKLHLCVDRLSKLDSLRLHHRYERRNDDQSNSRLHAWHMSSSPPTYFAAEFTKATFELHGLPTGEYRLTVAAVRGGAAGHAECRMSDAEPTNIEVTVTDELTRRKQE